jgi:hypothetical protein
MGTGTVVRGGSWAQTREHRLYAHAAGSGTDASRVRRRSTLHLCVSMACQSMLTVDIQNHAVASDGGPRAVADGPRAARVHQVGQGPALVNLAAGGCRPTGVVFGHLGVSPELVNDSAHLDPLGLQFAEPHPPPLCAADELDTLAMGPVRLEVLGENTGGLVDNLLWDRHLVPPNPVCCQSHDLTRPPATRTHAERAPAGR